MIAVAPATNDYTDTAEQLAIKLNLPLVLPTNQSYPLLLVIDEQHLAIRSMTDPAMGSVFVDFLAGKLAHRVGPMSSGAELLCKAVKLKNNPRPFVLDATTGLAQDAFVLANRGCRVCMVEQSAVLVAMIEDAMQRASGDQVFGQLALTLVHSNAIDYLSQLETDLPEVIYLDPMFPERRKSAKVKKEMQVLQQLVGGIDDAPLLLRVAREKATSRVVVKRPIQAEVLSGQVPSFQLCGKNIRFDIYQASSTI